MMNYIDINPICIGLPFNCINNQLISVISSLGFDYRPLYSGSWSFSFKSNFKTLGECLDSGDISEGNLLKQYYGYIINVSQEEVNTSINSIKRQVQNGRYPVFLRINSFWCPWDRNYQIAHTPHACLITGFTDSSFYCTDAHYHIKSVELVLENYLKGYINHGIFMEIDDGQKKFNEINWLNILYSSVTKLLHKDKNDFDEMVDFGVKIKLGFNPIDEFPNLNILQDGLLHKKLSFISNNRVKFSLFLKYISQYYNNKDYILFAEQLEKAGDMWKQIRQLIHKVVYASIYGQDMTRILDKTASEIFFLAEYEHKIALDILKLIESTNCFKSNPN